MVIVVYVTIFTVIGMLELNSKEKTFEQPRNAESVI